MLKQIFLFSIVVAVVCWLAGCSGDKKDQWRVAGAIEGAQGKTLLLEQPGKTDWVVYDTIKLNDNGEFDYSQNRPRFPEIYRLRLDDKYLYFPVDSTETIVVDATAANFGDESKISGSISADKIQKINELVTAAVKSGGETALVANDELKREIAEVIGNEWDGMTAYYAVNKVVGTTPLFDASRKEDLKYIRAVANMFMTNRSDDPRSQMLADMSFVAMRRFNSSPVTVYAEVISLPEIKLPDETGEMRSLNETVGRNKVVILDFNNYSSEIYPAYNLVLGEVYDKYGSQGLEIYQIGFDSDEFDWVATARNLPWITVYNRAEQGAQTLMGYNVTALPTMFVIGADGEKVVRLDAIENLEPTIKTML